MQNYLLAQFPDQRGPLDSDPAPDDATGVYLDIHAHGNGDFHTNFYSHA